jgi:hypothetical protein
MLTNDSAVVIILERYSEARELWTQLLAAESKAESRMSHRTFLQKFGKLVELRQALGAELGSREVIIG